MFVCVELLGLCAAGTRVMWMVLPVPHIACGVIENCSLRERVKELNKKQRQFLVAALLLASHWERVADI